MRSVRSTAITGLSVIMTVLVIQASVPIPSADSVVVSSEIMPTLTAYASRGLAQTVSAEPLGSGRLNFNLTGTWYRQKHAIPNAPDARANIATGMLGFSFGVSDFVDLFGSLGMFGSTGYSADKKSGVGTVAGGVQGSLPLPKDMPLRLGAQLYMLGGLSSNQVNLNYADGYDYFTTRTGYDFCGRIMESLVLGSETRGFKVHLNQAFVKSVEKEKKNLMLLGGGVQGIPAVFIVLGVEVNSRTYLSDIAMRTDPLWVTPSITFRTPFYLGFTLGGDIALSSERGGDSATRAIEPYRLFGGVFFSFDVLERMRQDAARKARAEAGEKKALEARSVALKAQTDSLTQKAREDSLASAQQRKVDQARADSIKTAADAAAARARQDSLSMAQVLNETRHKLEEEKSKRSDAEKQLLSTGLLILDAVYFESGRTDISINSKPYLNIIGKMLLKYPKLVLEVGGHTDNVGTTQSNQRLSQTRAESVRSYMIAVAPGLVGRLTAMGYGPSQPKAGNGSADGRKVNRRVELKVLNPEVLKEYNQ